MVGEYEVVVTEVELVWDGGWGRDMGGGMGLDIKMLDGRERADSLGQHVPYLSMARSLLSNTSAVVPPSTRQLSPPASGECQIHTWSCA